MRRIPYPSDEDGLYLPGEDERVSLPENEGLLPLATGCCFYVHLDNMTSDEPNFTSRGQKFSGHIATCMHIKLMKKSFC